MQPSSVNTHDDGNLFDGFLPGRNFCIQDEWLRKSMIASPRVEVVSPGRIHFSLFDYNHMRPPLPGGGGIGISTGAFTNNVVLQSGIKGSGIDHLPPAAQHIFMLFKALLGVEQDDISVAVKNKMPYSHCGYGSNVTLNTSIFWGLNAMFNYPFTREEAFTILTHNYIESTDDKMVHWGFDTGVGEAVLLFGGFVLIDERCRFVSSISVPELYTVIAKGKMASLACEDYISRGLVENGETGSVEAQINEEIGMVHQREYGKLLKAFLYEELIPVFEANDYEGLRRQIWKLNDLGTFKRMQISYKREVMLGFEEAAQSKGAIYCGISSTGPSMFGIMDNAANAGEFKKEIQETFSEYFEYPAIGPAGQALTVSVSPAGENY
jgi:predicted sugar kinase